MTRTGTRIASWAALGALSGIVLGLGAGIVYAALVHCSGVGCEGVFYVPFVLAFFGLCIGLVVGIVGGAVYSRRKAESDEVPGRPDASSV
jgi:hypothetical protein